MVAVVVVTVMVMAGVACGTPVTPIARAQDRASARAMSLPEVNGHWGWSFRCDCPPLQGCCPMLCVRWQDPTRPAGKAIHDQTEEQVRETLSARWS